MQQTVAVAVTKEENVDLTTIHACGLSCFYSSVAEIMAVVILTTAEMTAVF